jgi:hypothetical protein
VEHPTVSADQGESGDSRTFLERLYGGGAYEPSYPTFHTAVYVHLRRPMLPLVEIQWSMDSLMPLPKFDRLMHGSLIAPFPPIVASIAAYHSPGSFHRWNASRQYDQF